MTEWAVLKDKDRIYPKGLKYTAYKPYLRVEGDEKCIYCATHESFIGGIDYYHVEHFKPKSNPRFKHLVDDYNNLFYVCPICNRFKGKDWPNDDSTDLEVVSFINPLTYDYNSIFSVDEEGKIQADCISGKYMIERIFLNRPQLITERRVRRLVVEINDLIDRVYSHIELCMKSDNKEVTDFGLKFITFVKEIDKMKRNLNTLSPYEKNEITRE